MAYERGYSASGNPMNVGLPGGGGCPDTETLVPELPFDFLQPQMRRGVTQVGYGGPFVIRSNPIGAIIDTIRNFCFPQPMQTTDGNTYDSINGLGSYGAYSSPDLGAEGFAGGGYTPFVGTTPMCGAGYQYNVTMGCVPINPSATSGTMPMGGTMTMAQMMCPSTGPCDPCQINSMCQFGASLSELCTCQQMATKCANGGTSIPGEIASWNAFAATLAVRIRGKGCSDCNKYGTKACMPEQAKMNAAAMPPPTSTGTPAGNLLPVGTPGSPPTGYVPGPQSGGSTGGMTPSSGNTTVPMVPVTNPPPNQPPQIAARRLLRSVMPPLPQMPNPMSLTEGNVGLQPSREPLRGSFDPRRIYGRYYGSVVGRGRQIR